MKTLITCLFLIFSIPLFAAPAQLEPISEKKVSLLRQKFAQAQSFRLEDLNEKRRWDCELFGMRSRLQVKRQLGFYNFERPLKASSVRNKGAQLIKDYEVSIKGWRGTKGPLMDVVRRTKSGQLIGEMSIPKRTSAASSPTKTAFSNDLDALGDSGRVVISYSVCR